MHEMNDRRFISGGWVGHRWHRLHPDAPKIYKFLRFSSKDPYMTPYYMKEMYLKGYQKLKVSIQYSTYTRQRFSHVWKLTELAD